MAIVLPMVQKDVFGGPAGSTQDAMQMLIAGILKGAEKRRLENQEQLASTRAQNYNQNRNFVNQSEYAPPPDSPTGFIDALFADPTLDSDTKERWAKNLGLKSEIDERTARAEALRNPQAKERKMVKLEFYRPDGTAGSRMVPEDQYDQAAQFYEDQGYQVGVKPDKGEKFGEPVLKGNNWIQQNLDTKRWQQAWSDPEGWVDYIDGETGEKMQKNTITGEKKPYPVKKENYFENTAQLIDDNRAHHEAIMKEFTDPLGGIRDPEGYNKARLDFEDDVRRISSGMRPKWAEGLQPDATADATFSYIVGRHADLMRSGKDPMALPNMRKATEDFFSKHPQYQKQYVDQMNALQIQSPQAPPPAPASRRSSSPPAVNPNVSSQVRNISEGLRKEEDNAPLSDYGTRHSGESAPFNVGDMTVKKYGKDFLVYDKKRDRWRMANGAERAKIEDEVYGRLKLIEFTNTGMPPAQQDIGLLPPGSRRY